MLTRLADAYRKMERFDEAEKIYLQNLEQGYDKFSLLGLAKLHATRNEMNEMIRCYRELVTKEEEDGWFFSEIATKLLDNSQFQEAAQLYQRNNFV